MEYLTFLLIIAIYSLFWYFRLYGVPSIFTLVASDSGEYYLLMIARGREFSSLEKNMNFCCGASWNGSSGDAA